MNTNLLGDLTVVRNGALIAMADVENLLPGDKLVNSSAQDLTVTLPGVDGSPTLRMGAGGAVQLAAYQGETMTDVPTGLFIENWEEPVEFAQVEAAGAAAAGSSAASGAAFAGLSGAGLAAAAGGVIFVGSAIGNSSSSSSESTTTAPQGEEPAPITPEPPLPTAAPTMAPTEPPTEEPTEAPTEAPEEEMGVPMSFSEGAAVITDGTPEQLDQVDLLITEGAARLDVGPDGAPTSFTEGAELIAALTPSDMGDAQLIGGASALDEQLVDLAMNDGGLGGGGIPESIANVADAIMTDVDNEDIGGSATMAALMELNPLGGDGGSEPDPTAGIPSTIGELTDGALTSTISMVETASLEEGGPSLNDLTEGALTTTVAAIESASADDIPGTGGDGGSEPDPTAGIPSTIGEVTDGALTSTVGTIETLSLQDGGPSLSTATGGQLTTTVATIESASADDLSGGGGEPSPAEGLPDGSFNSAENELDGPLFVATADQSDDEIPLADTVAVFYTDPFSGMSSGAVLSSNLESNTVVLPGTPIP